MCTFLISPKSLRSRVSLFFLLPIAFLTIASSCHAEVRTWQDHSGKFQVKAELVKVKDKRVFIRKLNGKISSVPLAKLSDTDLQYLSSLENTTLSSNMKGKIHPTSYRELNKELLKLRSAKQVVVLYGAFIAANNVVAKEKDLAKKNISRWENLAAKNAKRLGTKWLIPSRIEEIKRKEIDLIKAAHRMMDVKNDRVARKYFEDASKIHPESIRADFYLGLLNAIIANHPNTAEKHFRECIKRLSLSPDRLQGIGKANYVAALNNAALAQVRLRKLNKALAYWKEALEISPQTPELVQNLGRILFIAESASNFRLSKTVRNKIADLYSLSCIKNHSGNFDRKIGWLYIPYIDEIDETTTEDSDGEDRIIAWCTATAVSSEILLTSREAVKEGYRVAIYRNGLVHKNLQGKVLSIASHSPLALIKITGLNALPVSFSTTNPPIGSDIKVIGYNAPTLTGGKLIKKQTTILDIVHQTINWKTHLSNNRDTTRLLSTHSNNNGLPSVLLRKSNSSSVSATLSQQQEQQLIFHDYIGSNGMDGAPLVNSNGKVIGINLIHERPIGYRTSKYGFATTSAAALNFVQRVIPNIKSIESTPSLPEESVFQIAVLYKAPRLAWTHRIEAMHQLRRHNNWYSYEDKTCMNCAGTKRLQCPNRKCSNGSVGATQLVPILTNPITGEKVMRQKKFRVPCPTCQGTNRVKCPYCNNTGIDLLTR